MISSNKKGTTNQSIGTFDGSPIEALQDDLSVNHHISIFCTTINQFRGYGQVVLSLEFLEDFDTKNVPSGSRGSINLLTRSQSIHL